MCGFVPTYRGRRVNPTDPKYVTLIDELSKEHGGVVEVGLMCRSGFGEQEGDFELFVGKIEAVERGGGGMAALWDGIKIVIGAAVEKVATAWSWLVGGRPEGQVMLP